MNLLFYGPSLWRHLPEAFSWLCKSLLQTSSSSAESRASLQDTSGLGRAHAPKEQPAVIFHCTICIRYVFFIKLKSESPNM